MRKYIEVLYVLQRWPQITILQPHESLLGDNETTVGMIDGGKNNLLVFR
jgi:hypothetical protein